MWNLRNKTKKQKERQAKNRLLTTENKLIVTSVEVDGGMVEIGEED